MTVEKPMRVLVLGARGMLGHVLFSSLGEGFDVVGTVRGRSDASNVVGGVDVADLANVGAVLDAVAPDVVINCIGLVKQRPEGAQAAPCIRVNALFPHELAALAKQRGVRMIHWSTDCVFSGRAGPYGEDSVADPVDVYGRSKLLGEVEAPHVLTLRTSLVGRELDTHLGLVDWFLSQPDGASVRGFRRALYSGLSTTTATRVVAAVLRSHRDLSGVWQVASEPISKFDLLELLRDAFARSITITPDDTFACDRRLDGSRFARHTGIVVPSWPDMVREIRASPVPGSNA